MRLVRVVHRLWLRFLPFQLVIIIGGIGLAMGLTCAMTIVLLKGQVHNVPLPNSKPQPTPATISVLFTPEVQHWEPQIMQWSAEYGIDPNMLATVIQIESCGDYLAGSGAGAQGLFQVMPFHFQAGEDMHDPDTNALRGIEYLRGGLVRAGGHIGLAMAGYNGGWGLIDVGWAHWPLETRLYYLWGTQIYLDALQGKTQSGALQNWLSSGGARLCAQAASRFITPPPSLQPGQPTPTVLIIPQ
jgi:hypothetical protein